MTSAKKADAPLVDVVTRFDAGLQRYEALVDEASKLRVTSEKHLSRAHRMFEECAAAEGQLVELLHEFVTAMRAAQGRQEKAMAARVEAADVLDAKIKARDALLERLGQLGENARSTSTSLAALLAGGDGGVSRERVLASLAEVEERTRPIVGEAEALFAAAQEEGWLDIASDADSFRQQLGAARKKANALTRTSTEGDAKEKNGAGH